MKMEREGVEVDFVTQVTHHSQEGPHWVKLEDGVRKLYFPCYGWREVKPTRRDVTGEIEIDAVGVLRFKAGERRIAPHGYHFERVTGYSFTEEFADWLEGYYGAPVLQHKRQYIVITKEE